jgi:hypothetical protein
LIALYWALLKSRTHEFPCLKHSSKQNAALFFDYQIVPTGNKGFDQITEGGLPKNRTTLSE